MTQRQASRLLCWPARIAEATQLADAKATVRSCGIRPAPVADSTYWNPSWTLAHGAIETTDIADMTRTAIGIGGGRLLSRSSYRAQIDPHIGFGRPAPKTCERCTTLNRYYGYGIGLVTNGNRGQWLLQNPLFAGEAAIESYLPSQRISIAIATTFKPTAYTAQGNPSPYWQVLWAKIGKVLAPRDAPAVPPRLG